MSLINLSLIFVAGLDFGLAVLIFLLNRKNKINITFAITVFFLATWILGMAMFRNAYDETSALVWTWVQNGSGSLVTVFLFLLSVYFPYKNKIFRPWQILLIIVSIIVMMLIVVIPGIWISKIILIPPNNQYVMNIFGILYFNLHFFTYLILALINFFKKYLSSQGFIRKQLLYFLISASFTAIFGSIFGAIIPLVLGKLGPYWLGPYFTVPTVLILIWFVYKNN